MLEHATVSFLWPEALRSDTLGNEVLLLLDSLATLEQQRSGILTRILDLGDFRSGSITSISGPCGKPPCRCHQAGQPGHGPNYRLTRKVKGKTVSETFSSPAELRKAQLEVEAFHRFRELSVELHEVNESTSRLGTAYAVFSL